MSSKPNKFAFLAVVKNEKTEPVDQSTNPVDQTTSLDDQSTSPEIVKEPLPVVDQSTSQPVDQPTPRAFPSRVERRMKGIRFPVKKLAAYEEWHFRRRHLFRDFQDAVEYAMDWLTSQPDDQLTSRLLDQSTALINKELNNQLSFNGEKAAKDMAAYTRLTNNPAKPKDWEAYAEVAHIDSAAIEQGIKEGIQRAKQLGRPVLGFRWCVFAIQDAARAPVKSTGPVELCDLCRPMNGLVYGDPSDTSKGVKRCTHGT